MMNNDTRRFINALTMLMQLFFFPIVPFVSSAMMGHPSAAFILQLNTNMRKNNYNNNRIVNQSVKLSNHKEESNNSLAPQRPLTPPFPDGLCNGRLVTLPPSEHYELDSNLSGNALLLPPRDIQVWLPIDYDKNPSMRFPVLYCHDGQNAM